MSAPLKKGFTVMELLVVIAIIGLLASILFASLNEARKRAKISAATGELRQIRLAIESIRIDTGQAFFEITENPYSQGGCFDIDLRDIPESHRCYATMHNSYININEKSGGMLDAYIKGGDIRDPWGSPYVFDENELEFDHDPCRKDSIRSVGPDGYIKRHDNPSMPYDDIVYRLHFSQPECY